MKFIKGIDYNKFTPIIIQAIQEQQQIINDQSREIAVLKEALTRQKDINAQLQTDTIKLDAKMDELAKNLQKFEQLLNLATSTEK